MSKKFDIKPPIWPKEYTFTEFAKLNPHIINENQLINLYNQYLNKYLTELGEKKIHFKQSKINQLITELKQLQQTSDVTIATPGGGGWPNNYSAFFTGDTTGNTSTYPLAVGDEEHITTEFDPIDFGIHNNGFTVSYWVKPHELGSAMFAFGRRKAGSTGRFEFGINTSNNAYVGVGASKKITTAHGMSVNNWYHWVITYAGNSASTKTLKAYRDGTEIIDSTTNFTNTDNGCPIYFGGRNISSGTYNNGWACSLDEVAIFDKIKSLSSLSRNGKPINLKNESGLIGYWRFENNAKDSSGNGNHGTLENNATFSTDTPSK